MSQDFEFVNTSSLIVTNLDGNQGNANRTYFDQVL